MTEHKSSPATHSLGNTPGRLELLGREMFGDICLLMAEQASRQIQIFSYDLDAPLFDRQPFIDALKSLVLQSQFSRIQILLQKNQRVQKEGHRLIDLSRRLPTYIEIRRPHLDHKERRENFLVADRIGYIRRKSADRYHGEADFKDRAEAIRLSELFDSIWDCSDPDTDLRGLHIS